MRYAICDMRYVIRDVNKGQEAWIINHANKLNKEGVDFVLRINALFYITMQSAFYGCNTSDSSKSEKVG